MKLLKSTCGKVWLFDCAVETDCLTAGLACFLPECPTVCTLQTKTKVLSIELSPRAIGKPVPVRIINARLPLLDYCP